MTASLEVVAHYSNERLRVMKERAPETTRILTFPVATFSAIHNLLDHLVLVSISGFVLCQEGLKKTLVDEGVNYLI